MTTRIEHVAGLIVDNVSSLAAYSDETVEQIARRINDTTGWTWEDSAPLNGVTRTEGAVLSADELAAALRLAEAWRVTVPTDGREG